MLDIDAKKNFSPKFFYAFQSAWNSAQHVNTEIYQWQDNFKLLSTTSKDKGWFGEGGWIGG